MALGPSYCSNNEQEMKEFIHKKNSKKNERALKSTQIFTKGLCG